MSLEKLREEKKMLEIELKLQQGKPFFFLSLLFLCSSFFLILSYFFALNFKQQDHNQNPQQDIFSHLLFNHVNNNVPPRRLFLLRSTTTPFSVRFFFSLFLLPTHSNTLHCSDALPDEAACEKLLSSMQKIDPFNAENEWVGNGPHPGGCCVVC